MESLQPTRTHERIEIIDIFRGFALFGILLANMLWFIYPVYLQSYIGDPNPFTKDWTTLDYILKTLMEMFIDGKFITLFSMLFGFGMVIMYERATARKQAFVPFYLRRLFFLFLFGLLHGYFIWFGDILADYAVIGLFLLLFHRLKGTTLLVISYIIFGLYFIFAAFIQMGMYMMNESITIPANQLQLIQQTIQIHQTGSFMDLMKANIEERNFYFGAGNSSYILHLLTLLPFLAFFFFGAGVAKKKWIQCFSEKRKKFATIGIITFIIGAFFSFILPLLIPVHILQYASAPFLTIAYCTFLLFLFETTKGLRLFIAPGRMALTNYLMQSIFFTFLYGPFALKIYGEISYSFALLLGIFFFIIQVILSHWWMKRFYFGPFEWLWRQLTYMKKQPFKKSRT